MTPLVVCILVLTSVKSPNYPLRKKILVGPLGGMSFQLSQMAFRLSAQRPSYRTGAESGNVFGLVSTSGIR